jgi:uncharacterized protein (DUF427 family)
LIDTVDTWLLFEPGRHPTFVVPVAALPPLVGALGEIDERDGRWVALDGRPERRVRVWPEPPVDLPALAGLAAVPLDVADEWYEEDVLVSFKPRDPYRRVDVLASSRRVSVHVDDVLVADTDRPRLLLETGMPPIWYVPFAAVEAEKLRPAELVTRCQYKGMAHYWDVVTETGVHEALVWGYRDPIGTAGELAGHVAFTPWDPAVITSVDGIVQQVGDPEPSWQNPSAHLVAAQ